MNEDVDERIGQLPECGHEFHFKKVEEDEVLRLLRGLDVNKAVGVDAIGAKLLKTAASGIGASLTTLFNHCLERGQISQEWKLANVTPVPKKGHCADISN